MWLWLIVSLIILTACIIFALRIFAASSNFMIHQQEEKDLIKQNKRFIFYGRQSSIGELQAKIKAIEQDYAAHFNKLQHRIDTLELERSRVTEGRLKGYEGEWEELYYKTAKEKEAAEEALEAAIEEQAVLMNQLKELETKSNAWREIQGMLDDRQKEVLNYKNRIEILGREVAAAGEKEKRLEEEIEVLKNVRHDHEKLRHLYSRLLSEADELRSRVKEINSTDISLTKKIHRLSELESNFEISNQEKQDLRKSVEEIITENEALSIKLQELQDRLTVEKYAS